MVLMNDTRPERFEGLTLTERDKAKFRILEDFRLVTSADLRVYTGAQSIRKDNDRNRKLWGNEFIDRPKKAQEIFAFADERHIVNALGQEGARWLAENDGVRFPKGKGWNAANKDLKSAVFVKHTLGVSKMMIGAIAETRAIEGLSIIRRKALWETSKHYSPKVKNPHSMPTVLDWPDGKEYPRNTKTDYPFAIRDARGGRVRRGLSFLEYDRATEPYTSASPYSSSILQKDIGYADIFARKLHTERYGLRNYRRLFVTEGDDTHLESVMRVYQNHVAHIVPADAFLYTTVAAIEAGGFFGPETWLDGNGEIVSLLPEIIPHQSSHQVTVRESALSR